LTAGTTSTWPSRFPRWVLHEVRDADRARATGGEHLSDRLVRADGAVELGRDRLVQQDEIDVVDAEAAQTSVEADERLVVAVVADPELGDDEDLAAVDPGAPDRLADLALVAVGGGGVDERIAVRDRSLDRARRLLGRALEDAKSEGGHLDTVVQRQGRDGRCAQGVSSSKVIWNFRTSRSFIAR